MKLFALLFVSLYVVTQTADAASVSFTQTSLLETGLVTLDVMLDPEGESINAFSGTVSFPEGIFSIESLSTIDTVVPIWIQTPVVSEERNFSGRGQVVFEGMIPGGFQGVRSPYYEGVKPGKLFSITFRPVDAGNATILSEGVKLLRNDGMATAIPSANAVFSITVPDLKTLPKAPKSRVREEEIRNSSLQLMLSQDDSVERGKWMLVVHDTQVDKTSRGYFVAETRTSNPRDLNAYEWSPFKNPFVLQSQARDKFIHVKALYTDGSYAYATLSPVENFKDMSNVWRILIVLVALLLVLFYASITKRIRT